MHVTMRKRHHARGQWALKRAVLPANLINTHFNTQRKSTKQRHINTDPRASLHTRCELTF